MLNSTILNFYYLKKFSTKKEGAFPEIQTYFFETLPIPSINGQIYNDTVHAVVTLHDMIKHTKSEDTKKKLMECLDILTLEIYVNDLLEINILEPIHDFFCEQRNNMIFEDLNEENKTIELEAIRTELENPDSEIHQSIIDYKNNNSPTAQAALKGIEEAQALAQIYIL